MPSLPFSPAVERLFALPAPQWAERPEEWPDYQEAAGVTLADVPMLLRLAGEPALLVDGPATGVDPAWLAALTRDGELAWGVAVHAWRAIGQLRAEEALEPLARLFVDFGEVDNQWLLDDLPLAFVAYGRPAVPVLEKVLLEPGHAPGAYHVLAETLGRIGQHDRSTRFACIAALVAKLERYLDNDPETNGMLVAMLVELKAVEAEPTMAMAFLEERVDERAAGDWEDVQVALGLKSFEAALQAREQRAMEDFSALGGLGLVPPGVGPVVGDAKREAERKKAKRKLAQASGKKNRKR